MAKLPVKVFIPFKVINPPELPQLKLCAPLMTPVTVNLFTRVQVPIVLPPVSEILLVIV